MDLTAERERAELLVENAALRRYLIALGDIALAGEVPLDDLLQRIVEAARGLLRARFAALGVFDARGRVTKFFTAGVTADERAAIGALPVGTGLLGLIVREKRIIRVSRIADHPVSVGFPRNHPPMTSFLGGPIARGRAVYGNLYLTDRLDGADFSTADEELLAVLATQAATAIENAQRFERVRREESSLATMFDSMSDIVFTTDLAGRIVRLNRRAAAWTGHQPTDIVGRLADDVFPLVDDFGRSISSVGAADAHPLGLNLSADNGERIPVERAVSPISDAEGETIGAVQVLRDLRPQREVEQLKANIITLVSHELRTPLSHIKGYASTLLQPDVDWDAATQRDFIASIERQADRLARLITDILEISRLDAGGTAGLEVAPVAPAVLVERGLRQASPNAGNHPIRTGVAPDLPLVSADATHVERVLGNLIENAAKYSPAEAPIDVEAHLSGDSVTFAVRDRGTGLTDDEKSHLFERFYRSPRVKHRTPGTGLGLAICREIVQAHGGTIWAESTEGEGSVFRFTLPRADSAEGGQS